MAAAEIQRHNSTVLQNLEKGDLVEFKRGVYSHWAVYAGKFKLCKELRLFIIEQAQGLRWQEIY